MILLISFYLLLTCTCIDVQGVLSKEGSLESELRKFLPLGGKGKSGCLFRGQIGVRVTLNR